MKKIVIIGANDFQNQLILKAKEMGFDMYVHGRMVPSVSGPRIIFIRSALWRSMRSWKNAEKSSRMQWQPSHRILRILPSAKWQQA